MIDGIDLCSIQWPVDGRKVADAGFKYAYVKSSQYSSTRDFMFDHIVEELTKNGVSCGAYHFCYQGSDPIAQMRFFYKASGGLGKNSVELPPMLDWEFCKNLQKNTCVPWIEQAAFEAEKLWYPNNDSLVLRGRPPRKPVIYTYPNFCMQHQPELSKSNVGQYPLCFAAYKSSQSSVGWELVPWKPSESDKPESALGHIYKTPAPWKEPTLWQYSGNKGLKVPGIAADCDRQVFLGSSGEFDIFRGIYKEVDSISGKAAVDEFPSQ